MRFSALLQVTQGNDQPRACCSRACSIHCYKSASVLTFEGIQRQMAEWKATAAMARRGRPRSTASDGDRGLDAWVRIVAFDGNIFELESEEVFDFRI